MSHKFNNNNQTVENADIREDVARVKDALSQTAHDVRRKTESVINQSIDGIKEKSNDLEENVLGYVKEHPVKVIAFSVVAGMILGKLLNK